MKTTTIYKLQEETTDEFKARVQKRLEDFENFTTEYGETFVKIKEATKGVKFDKKVVFGVLLGFLLIVMSIFAYNGSFEANLQHQVILSQEMQTEFHKIAEELRVERDTLQKRIEEIDKQILDIKQKWHEEEGKKNNAKELLDDLKGQGLEKGITQP